MTLRALPQPKTKDSSEESFLDLLAEVVQCAVDAFGGTTDNSCAALTGTTA